MRRKQPMLSPGTYFIDQPHPSYLFGQCHTRPGLLREQSELKATNQGYAIQPSEVTVQDSEILSVRLSRTGVSGLQLRLNNNSLATALGIATVNVWACRDASRPQYGSTWDSSSFQYGVPIPSNPGYWRIIHPLTRLGVSTTRLGTRRSTFMTTAAADEPVSGG